MKRFKPAASRAAESLVWAGFWGGAGYVGGSWLVACVVWLKEIQGLGLRPGEVELLWGMSFLVSGLFALICLLNALNTLSSRYDLGATELTLHSGAIWRGTRTIPILEVQKVESSSGPLMRLLGLADLKVHLGEGMPVTLCGLRDAEAVRRAMLDRREALREAAMEGGVNHFKHSRDLLFERLNRVLERIERRLPAAPRT